MAAAEGRTRHEEGDRGGPGRSAEPAVHGVLQGATTRKGKLGDVIDVVIDR